MYTNERPCAGVEGLGWGSGRLRERLDIVVALGL